jgi:hypothetical protein
MLPSEPKMQRHGAKLGKTVSELWGGTYPHSQRLCQLSKWLPKRRKEDTFKSQGLLTQASLHTPSNLQAALPPPWALMKLPVAEGVWTLKEEREGRKRDQRQEI